MILLVNGPNLNLLGEREPEIYGRETLADVERMVTEACAAYGLEVKAFQSNWEGALLDFLQEHRHEAQGVILNPGALTHTSRALPDCLRSLPCPTIEV
ncbi:MAG TPA: type II 3-dehydroquinate dehydratase, partial [Anaeromyxobacteraceae bacterium]